jgi:hypothetical protein
VRSHPTSRSWQRADRAAAGGGVNRQTRRRRCTRPRDLRAPGGRPDRPDRPRGRPLKAVRVADPHRRFSPPSNVAAQGRGRISEPFRPSAACANAGLSLAGAEVDIRERAAVEREGIAEIAQLRRRVRDVDLERAGPPPRLGGSPGRLGACRSSPRVHLRGRRGRQLRFGGVADRSLRADQPPRTSRTRVAPIALLSVGAREPVTAGRLRSTRRDRLT